MEHLAHAESWETARLKKMRNSYDVILEPCSTFLTLYDSRGHRLGMVRKPTRFRTTSR